MPEHYRVRLTSEPASDLQEIHDYLAKDSPHNAAVVIERLLDALDSLELFPVRTVAERQVPKLKYPIQTLPVKPYAIYSRVIEDENVVVIRRIQHGARKPPDRID